MRDLHLIYGQTTRRFSAHRHREDFAESEVRNREMRIVDKFPMPIASGVNLGGAPWSCGTEGFFKDLPTEARSDFESLATHFHCPGSKVLISEAQEPSSILFLLEGEVNISMNSSDGRRLLLGVAGAGDTLGLTSAISGNASEIRAQAMYPCRLASLERGHFFDFLSRHPIASQNVVRELGLHYTRTCERLRMLALTSSAMARLAYLLLEWCKKDRQTESDVQIRCALTHREIGECIGTSRETVTRTLADFKSHDLVRQRGSIFVVPSCRALAAYAGIDSTPDSHQPAA
jgi:CRP/FNR family transcriptional regulator